MTTIFNQLTENKLRQLNTIFPLGKDELNLFKKAGRFSRKTIQNHHRLSNQTENYVNDYEALAYYCQKGVKPFWISSFANFKPSKILYNLFIDDYELFEQFVGSIISDKLVLKRLGLLISKSDFFFNYNRFSVNNEFINNLTNVLKPKDYQVLIEKWLNNLVRFKTYKQDIEIENLLAELCENNSQFSTSISKKIKSRI